MMQQVLTALMADFSDVTLDRVLCFSHRFVFFVCNCVDTPMKDSFDLGQTLLVKYL